MRNGVMLGHGILWESQDKDNEGNLLQGNVLLKDVKNSIFRSEGRLVVGMGGRI